MKSTFQDLGRMTALVWFAMALAPAASQAGFTIRDLGALASFPGGSSTGAAINALGQTAGQAQSGAGAEAAVIASSTGGFTLAGAPSGSSWATGINNGGVVVGSFVNPTDHVAHAFSSVDGKGADLGTLGGGSTLLTGVNNGGEVVGTAATSGGERALIGTTSGGFHTINPLGTGSFSQGNAINDSGMVVGSSNLTAGGLVTRAFLASQGGQAADLFQAYGLTTQYNQLGYGQNSSATAINALGHVAGTVDFGSGSHAFLAMQPGQGSSTGTLIDLGVTGSAGSSSALGINGSDDVVGTLGFGGSATDAFVWDPKAGMLDLNSLIPASERGLWTLQVASGINDSDQIVGSGLINGVAHGFLLTPIPGQSPFTAPSSVPEPAAFLLMGTGLLVILVLRVALLRRERTAVPATA